MHDLSTIQNDAAKTIGANNYAELVATVTAFRAQGYFVLAKYAGLSLMSIEKFADATEANAALSHAQSTATGSEHFALLTPTTKE